MQPPITSSRTRLGRILRSQLPVRVPHAEKILAGISILGVIGLSYVAGAAVMFFQLPSYEFLHQAFTGSKAWQERSTPVVTHFSPPEIDHPDGVTVDQRGQAYDGFTLVTTTAGPQALLCDMLGSVVHHWEMPFSQVWPRPPHVEHPVGPEQIHWFRCHLFPNGDLLAIYQVERDTPSGYGLVKLSKESKLLWKYEARVHHDLDVDEQGRIYTLAEQVAREAPPGLDYLPTPYVAESLLILSPDGKKLASIPLAEAFRDSPYAIWLSTAIAEQATPKDPKNFASSFDAIVGPLSKGDLIHANSVKILSPARAKKFPLFQAGQVLISLRSFDCLAVLDIPKRSVAWAARGPWRIQHDAELLDNGHLLVFDNHGWTKGCRILEYDPVTQAIPWAYTEADASPFFAAFRGMKQRLPNGNTLIVDPENRRLFEVTQSKKLVWEFFCSMPSDSTRSQSGPVEITGARRYSSDELTFLKGVARARP